MTHYINFDLELPLDYDNLEEIQLAAHIAVNQSVKQMRLLPDQFTEHKADMVQTALLALFAYKHSVRLRAMAEAKYCLMDYVRCVIWGLNLEDSEACKGWFQHLIDDLVPHEPEDGHSVDVLAHHTLSRRTEEEVIHLEDEIDEEFFRRRVQRAFITVLAGMNGKVYGADVVKAAEVLSYTAMGYTIADVAEGLGMAGEEVFNILNKRRRTIREYLALPPVMQALVQTKGATDYYEADELTEEALNSGHATHLKLRTGVYQLQHRIRKDRPNNPVEVKLMRQVTVNGKNQTIGTQIARMGRVTYERVCQAEQLLCERASELYA